MFTFAQSLQEWAEQSWDHAFLRNMVWSVHHLQTHMWCLVDFTLDDVLPVLEVEQVSEPGAWLVSVPLPILELALRSQQEDLSPVCPEDINFWWKVRTHPPGMVATAQPRGLSMGLPPGIPPMATDVMIPLSVSKPNKESLPIVVKQVAMYSSLVYRMWWWESGGLWCMLCSFRSRLLWIKSLELQSLSCRVYITEWMTIFIL